MAAINAAFQQHPGAKLVSVDGFHQPPDFFEDPPLGRVIVFTYPTEKHLDVMVKKWVFATGEHHLHVSASFLPSQALNIEGAFDWIAAHLGFAADAKAILTASAGTSEVGVQLDEYASTRAGFPFEDLAVIPAAVPESARPVSKSMIGMLANAWGVRVDGPKVFHAGITRGSEEGFYVAYSGRDGVLVIRTSGQSAYALDTANVEAYGLGPERLPADVAAWLGVVPAIRFGFPWRIPHEEYKGRVDGSMGGEPWTELLIRHPDGWWRAVYVPDKGLFEAIMPEEGTVELHVLPAGRFFDVILRQIDSMYATRTV
ncbi:hypothetical protein [Devriesea agamarum]|uniref:hypothetical protein n=1 Tax=Devriesea agamarum TaxID=472569 RepID=UPI00071C32B6|nr:hypothetical protein [Devriesea agamarum]